MSRKYLVGGIEMTANELIEFAEQQYGCQAGEGMKFTLVAAAELREHGISVEQALAESEKPND